jgi:hypothetical protein
VNSLANILEQFPVVLNRGRDFWNERCHPDLTSRFTVGVKDMAIIHKTISAIAVAAITAIWGAASSVQAQQPGNPVYGSHSYNAGIVRPPNLSAGIVNPTINPGIGQPLVGHVGRLHNYGYAGGFRNHGFPASGLAGGYQSYYNHHHFHYGQYGHYPLAPFDYPNIVPEYSH